MYNKKIAHTVKSLTIVNMEKNTLSLIAMKGSNVITLIFWSGQHEEKIHKKEEIVKLLHKIKNFQHNILYFKPKTLSDFIRKKESL